MNLGGIVLGGYVDQANKQAELGVKRGQLGLSLAQLAGQRLKTTVDQIQQIVSSLPSDADRPKVQGTLAALKQDAQVLAQGAGFNPQTMGMSIDAMIANTPTIQTAAQLKGGASTTQAAAAAPGAAITAAATAGGAAAGKLPYSTTDIKPGSAVIPTAAIIPPNGIGGPPTGPAPSAGGVPGVPAAAAPSAASTAPVPTPGAGMAGTNPTGGGVIPNAAGGFTNTNSPALVNLTQGNQPAYLEQQGKDVASFITQKQTGVAGYQATLNAIGELKPTLLTTKTGGATATTAVADLGKFASRFGVDVNKYLPDGWQVDPTKYDIANKAITQLATAFAKSNFPNRITNNDMQIAIAATPNFGNTPEANAQLLSNLESVARLHLAEAKFYAVREAQIRKAGGVPDWNIQYEWQDTLSKMTGISPQLKQAFASADAQAPGASASSGSSPPSASGGGKFLWTPDKGIVPAQ